MTNTQLAWAAGLFEGEGSISLKQSTPGRSITLSVAMTDYDVLERFNSIFPGYLRPKNKGSNNPSHYKPLWEWRLHKISDCYATLLAMMPFFGTRRSYQALNALDQMDGI